MYVNSCFPSHRSKHADGGDSSGAVSGGHDAVEDQVVGDAGGHQGDDGHCVHHSGRQPHPSLHAWRGTVLEPAAVVILESDNDGSLWKFKFIVYGAPLLRARSAYKGLQILAFHYIHSHARSHA